MSAFGHEHIQVAMAEIGAFLPVSSEGPERQLSGNGLAAGYDWDQAQS